MRFTRGARGKREKSRPRPFQTARCVAVLTTRRHVRCVTSYSPLCLRVPTLLLAGVFLASALGGELVTAVAAAAGSGTYARDPHVAGIAGAETTTGRSCIDVVVSCPDGTGCDPRKGCDRKLTACTALEQKQCREAAWTRAYRTEFVVPPHEPRPALRQPRRAWASAFDHVYVLTLDPRGERSEHALALAAALGFPIGVGSSAVQGVNALEWGSDELEARLTVELAKPFEGLVDFTHEQTLAWWTDDQASVADLGWLRQALRAGKLRRDAFDHDALRHSISLAGRPPKNYAQVLGEVSHSLSMAVVYSRMLREGHSKVLILEDDVCATDWIEDVDLPRALTDVSWDLIKLGDCYREVGANPMVAAEANTRAGNSFLALSGGSVRTMCTHAFGVSSRMATKLLPLAQMARWPSDVLISDLLESASGTGLRGYTLRYPAMTQSAVLGVNSSIQTAIEYGSQDVAKHRMRDVVAGKLGQCSASFSIENMPDDVRNGPRHQGLHDTEGVGSTMMVYVLVVLNPLLVFAYVWARARSPKRGGPRH